MSQDPEIVFAPLAKAPEKTAVVIAADGGKLGSVAEGWNDKADDSLSRAVKAIDFKGKAKSSLELLAPANLKLDRLLVVGAGKNDQEDASRWVMLGGVVAAKISARKTKSASVVSEIEGVTGGDADDAAADIALGILLRSYNFRKYKTEAGKSDKAKKENASNAKSDDLEKVVIHCSEPKKAEKAFVARRAIANGVNLARDLVNEPANTLGPVEFAAICKGLEKVGVEVEILDVKELTKLKMGALLAVGQGSERPSRVAVMQWNGAKSKKSKPLAFIGKGVVFDTGGISIKPAAGMEGMKGDMGGAACVTGLMHALAERKAKVNVVGIVGLVENMPSGNAYRPGDIVTSMSGQTIEVLNTDAEGRLVLADILWYAQQRFKPTRIVDFATLTGAIMIAIGKDFAGLFASDDDLSEDLLSASKATGERLWRMPVDKSFDKLIDTPNADMKNLGGRWGGACTAAAFLHRFVKDVPWAHIDLAGTAMDASKSDINQSWGSGWGVRLMDRFVADHHEE
jgi:leucyl aminopeptidase